MSLVAVISSDPLTRGMLCELVTHWKWEPVAIDPRTLRPTIQASQKHHFAGAVIDTRKKAKAVFQSAMKLQTLHEDHIPMVMLCDAIKRDKIDLLRPIGVWSVIESEKGDTRIIRNDLAASLGGEVIESEAIHIQPPRPETRKAGTASPSSKPEASAGGASAESGQKEGGSDTPEPIDEAEIPPIKWDGLYHDSGLLESETSSSAESVSTAPSDTAPPNIERELSRSETDQMLSEYMDAKPLKQNVQIALSVVRNPESSVEDLAAVIRRDQSLSARMLQVANSPAYRRGKPVSTVEQASVRIGLEGSRQAITVAMVMEQFESGTDDVVKPVLLWEHSFAVATLADEFAKATKLCAPDVAFMVGLLHDLGRVVMFDVLKERYANALRLARQSNTPPHAIEKRLFELNHADVADTVFKVWNFDDTIVNTVSNHHLSDSNIHHLDPAHEAIVLLLKAADSLAHAALLGDSGNDWISNTPLAIGAKKLSPGVIKNSLQRASRTAEDMRIALAAAGNLSMAKAYTETLRGCFGGPFRPCIVQPISNDTVHAFTILAQTLASAGGEPNITLIAGTDADDPAELAERIAAHDPEDAPPLPTLIVGGRPPAELAPFGERPVRHLPVPFRTPWFIREINTLLQHEPSLAAS